MSMEKDTKSAELKSVAPKDNESGEDNVIVAVFKWLLGYNFHLMGTKKEF